MLYILDFALMVSLNKEMQGKTTCTTKKKKNKDTKKQHCKPQK